ncbi:MAE_28990/MAE_18760 family HEPN-like nuclease [Exiguobacterium sp. s127]|uniref:MAE_28990/MAE_18760 family HEPN-like nuclease n=1 Tax=Exiguobacterium sp. s127 TaxID=2751210 RepID=UPI001BECE0F2|nr:MAE_28990/MAE_18760 family HEPN-like nuclease [Exiguobacterium sp. s127]
MSITTPDFEYEKRVSEVEYFFSCIDNLYKFVDKESGNIRFKKMLVDDSKNHSDFLIILKANSMLMLYNLIESTIRSLFQKVYDEITIQEMTYGDISKELQDKWIDVSYKKLKYTTTNFDQHKEKAVEMINYVIENKSIELTEKDIDLSGNIDLRQIKKIFENHGIDISGNHMGNKLGNGMNLVKDKRNKMAHGNISFIDGARDSTLEDLIRFKEDIIDYLNTLHDTVSDYIQNEDYRFASEEGAPA